MHSCSEPQPAKLVTRHESLKLFDLTWSLQSSKISSDSSVCKSEMPNLITLVGPFVQPMVQHLRPGEPLGKAKSRFCYAAMGLLASDLGLLESAAYLGVVGAK